MLYNLWLSISNVDMLHDIDTKLVLILIFLNSIILYRKNILKILIYDPKNLLITKSSDIV